MSTDRINEARRDLQRADDPPVQADSRPVERPEWPPTTRTPSEGLSQDELREFYLYWQNRDLEGNYQPMRDDELPVPDPEGNPISQQEPDQAEEAMLQEMHAADPSIPWFQKRNRDVERPAAAEGREDTKEQAWFIKRREPDEEVHSPEVERQRDRRR